MQNFIDTHGIHQTILTKYSHKCYRRSSIVDLTQNVDYSAKYLLMLYSLKKKASNLTANPFKQIFFLVCETLSGLLSTLNKLVIQMFLSFCNNSLMVLNPGNIVNHSNFTVMEIAFKTMNRNVLQKEHTVLIRLLPHSAMF